MTTLGIAPLLQNQLQFHLSVPPAASSHAPPSRRPGPIVIEKLGAPSAHRAPTAQNPLRYSTISEQEMDTAVRLARRDLKKKKMEVEMEQYMLKMAERASPKIDKKEDERRKARERLGIGSTTPRRGKQTQTDKGGPSNKGKVIKPRTKSRPDSPPTRDTDSYPPKLTADERTALEIRRLRKDLKTYVDEINRIDAVMHRPEPTTLAQDITDDEYYHRRKARVTGRATRSSRMVYDLKQQVKVIYDEITCMKPDVEPRKKSDVIKRLASVHRATVRALQDLVHQLPEAGHDDVAGLSRDLTALIQQLTECCHQMEIGEIKEKETVAKFVEKNPVAASVWKEVVDGPIEFVNVVHRPYQPREVQKEVRSEPNEGYDSDDRARTLRVGLENLLRARSPQKPDERGRPSVRIEQPKIEREEVKPSSKGVLLNRPKKKTAKKPILKPSVVIERTEKPHYTEATIAHRRKVRDPVQRQPARSRSRSPRAPSPRIVSTDRIEKLNLGIPNKWVEQAETAIKQRLQPLLTEAKRINAAQQSPGSMRQLLSVKALDRIECNASLLVDLILEDMLKDTACEMMALETAEKIEIDANLLMQGSEVHTMMDRLELMDREQREIRERWNSVRYNDTVEVPPIVLSETPRSPPPTLLDSETAPPPTELTHPPRHKLDKSPIVFTNQHSSARLRSQKLEMLRTEAIKQEMGLTELPKPGPVLTDNDVDTIHEYRNLKMITQQKRKKSVVAMESLADDVLEQIVEQVGAEMIRLTSEIDDQVCQQELAMGHHVSVTETAENLPTDDERFPAAFLDDSVMDLHDMIYDDDDRVPRYHDDVKEPIQIDRIAADAAEQRRQLFHSSNQSRPVENEDHHHHSYHDDRADEPSYHDDRRQVEEIRHELDQFEEVGHLESVVRESGQHDDSEEEDGDDGEEEDEETDEEESSRKRAAMLSQDVNQLEPIRTSQDTEEVATEAGEVDYSSEFVTTTESTGHDSRP